MPASEFHFNKTDHPSRLGVLELSKYDIETPYPTTPEPSTERSPVYHSTERRGTSAKEDAERSEPCGLSSATGSWHRLTTINSHFQPRPYWYITRGNGISTPLIPADQLPYNVNLRGVPRRIIPSQTRNMNNVGHLPYDGVLYELEEGLMSNEITRQSEALSGQHTSGDGRVPTPCAEQVLHEASAEHEMGHKSWEQSSWRISSSGKRLSRATSTDDRYVSILSLPHPINC